MERSSIVNEGFPGQSQTVPSAGSNHLEILGNPSSASGTEVHPEIETPRPCGRVTAANVMRLLEYQHFSCALTGRKLEPDTASLDHILPVRCGGEHVIENTQVLHKDVNRAKTTMTSQEFIQLCREVVIHSSTCQFEVSPAASHFLEE
jgi:hypothetical protein